MLALTVAMATPLVHDGPPEAAVQRATAITGKTGWEPKAWSELARGDPVALGGSTVFAVCTEGSGGTTEQALKTFRGAVLYAEPDVGKRREEVELAMACHGATTEQLGRMGFLAGVSAADTAGEDAAAAWFARARTWNPELAYDPDFPSKLAPVFAGSKPSAERFDLLTVPAADSINGRAAEAVPPGRHLVRTGGAGFWVETRAHAETVVWGDRVEVGPAQAASPEGRAQIVFVLAVGLGEGTAFGLVTEDRAWTGTAGRTDWTLFSPEPLRRPPSKAGPLGLLTAGLVVAAVGAGIAGQSFAQASSNGFRSEKAHRAGATRYYAGLGVMGAGLVGVGVSGVWMGTR